MVAQDNNCILIYWSSSCKKNRINNSKTTHTSSRCSSKQR